MRNKQHKKITSNMQFCGLWTWDLFVFLWILLFANYFRKKNDESLLIVQQSF